LLTLKYPTRHWPLLSSGQWKRLPILVFNR
jgi:hypothetical protein